LTQLDGASHVLYVRFAIKVRLVQGMRLASRSTDLLLSDAGAKHLSRSRSIHRLALVIPILMVFSGWMVVIGSSSQIVVPDLKKARWVRTADGWEQAHWFVRYRSASKPSLHPFLVAFGLSAVSACVLGLGSAGTRRIKQSDLPAILIDCNDRL
jgi:hypothetical protein